MGNRAIVVFVDDVSKPTHISPAVYLHWNGGPESIYPFLDELDRRHVRGEVDYECARFIHIVCDFFDQDAAGGLSIGASNGPAEISVKALHRYDPGDNGIYVVARHGGHRHVRRFTAPSDGPLVEFRCDAVDREQQEADRHVYNTGKDTIAGKLQAMRPKISE